MTRVRTTIEPSKVLDVEEAELLDLERQGLILSHEGGLDWQDAEPEAVESGIITGAPTGEPDQADPPQGGSGNDEPVSAEPAANKKGSR